MDYDEQSLNSMPTVAGGARPLRADIDELSDTTAVGQGIPGAPLGQIDQYQLVRKLGGGGFGVVYLARDTVSGVDVALKTLHPLLKSNLEEMEALRAKFALVSRLSHPNIASPLVLHPVQRIAITDDGVRNEMRLSPGDFIMVMRYAPGVTLSKWRRQFPDGVVPLDQALEVVRQVASALDYAHGEKIVHRDIKPANVMVETLPSEASRPSRVEKLRVEKLKGDGGASSPGEPQLTTNHFALATSKIRVRILDFGLAAEIRSSMSRVSTETGDTSGTRPYMAPEQWLGRKQDGRTDQYALACVAYEMLSGAPPFAGVFETGDPAIMMQAVKGEMPDEIDGASPAVNAALQKALAKNPTERFASCAEFVAALGGASKGGASSPSEPQPQPHTPARPEVSPHQAGDSAAQEAEVLRRKLSLSRALKAIPDADRADKELSKFVSTAEDEMAVAEEAIKLDKFSVAAVSLGNVESAFDELRKTRFAREEAARKAKEEAERLAREKAEAERRAREEAEARRKEAERKVREEAELKARKETEQKAREEAERFACEKSEAERKAGDVKEIVIGKERIRFHWCPSGTFMMGDPSNENGKSHPVILTKGFWMGETEVTQGLWKEVMGSNPSYFLDDKNCFGFGGCISPTRPVDTVSWNDCQEFLQKFNARAEIRHSGLRFALPTEAQWEYACRAGTTGAYGGTGRLNDMGWYADNSGNETHPVGLKRANDWGLYDMHGNVWEWCSDLYDAYSGGTQTNPVGALSGDYRVLRGGSYWNIAHICCSACRHGYRPAFRYRHYGLRLAAVENAP